MDARLTKQISDYFATQPMLKTWMCGFSARREEREDCDGRVKSHMPILRRIKKKFTKHFRKPIEVFLFHAVSDEYDEKKNMLMDWSQTGDFKNRIHMLKSRYVFISLEDAYRKLNSRLPRWRCYAVLTCDDGFASALDVLPFLEKEGIPISLFINPKYLDGVSIRDGYTENPQYITHDQLWALTSPRVTVGMHGYEHDYATMKTAEEFDSSVERCKEILQSHPHYISYYAYTGGRHNDLTQQILHQKHIVPLLVNGKSNNKYKGYISRRPIDSFYWDRTLMNIGMGN